MKSIYAWMAVFLLGLASSAAAEQTTELRDYNGDVASVATHDGGKLVRVVDPDGLTVDLYYDVAGCLDRTEQSDGTVHEFDCDGSGNSIPTFFVEGEPQ